MKITIDDKVCLKHKLTPQEVLIAMSIRTTEDVNSVIDNMLKREILIKHDNKLYVTQHWSEEIDTVLVDSSGAIDDEERLAILAEKMRSCFPEGKMPSTPYYYRCNKREVMLKLKKFFMQYGNYKDEDIIDATKRFVASFNGNYRYLPLIKYFILKNKPVQDEDGTNHMVEYSSLADYLENKGNDDNIPTASDDWLMNARN